MTLETRLAGVDIRWGCGRTDTSGLQGERKTPSKLIIPVLVELKRFAVAAKESPGLSLKIAFFEGGALVVQALATA